MNTRIVIPIIMLLFTNICIAETNTSIRSYPIPTNGNLELKFPDDWKSGFGEAPNGLPPTIAIGPENQDIYIKITVMWNFKNDPDFNKPQSLRKTAIEIGMGLLPNAVESKLDIMELKGSSNIGFYYTITDKNPKPGEWKYMSQGFVAVGDLQLVFTLLSHKKSSSDIDAAMTMFTEAVNN